MKKTKLLVLILSLALLVSGIVGISASAADADSTVAIEGKSISYMEVSTLVVAVSYENAELAEVKLNVWYGEKTDDPTVLTTTETIEVGGKACAMFVLDGTPAKNVADRVYYEAFIEGTEVKTALESYSVLEYALEGVVNSADAAEAARYQSIITYATSIQEWLKADGKFDGTLAKDYSYVQIEGGTLDENGTTKGVYANGTIITPVGEGVSNWAMDVNGAITVIAAGESFTVNGNANIEPSDYFETFEDGILPDTIQSVDTHPTTINLGNTYPVIAPTIEEIEGREGKVLSMSLSRTYTKKTILKISDTTKPEAGADMVEFSADFMLSPSTNATSVEFFNLVFTDSEGNTAYDIVLRNNSNTSGDTKGNIGLVIRTHAGGDSRTFLSQGLDTWFNLRVTYAYDETNGLSVNIYANNNLVSEFTVPYDADTYVDDSAITNAYIILDGNSQAAQTLNGTAYLDNLKFEHVVAD
ncbi:MAG: hypothetical protein IJ488_05250 [Clostridia bacterium]|nr:hypothetical protein [Clostridia bacterium]